MALLLLSEQRELKVHHARISFIAWGSRSIDGRACNTGRQRAGYQDVVFRYLTNHITRFTTREVKPPQEWQNKLQYHSNTKSINHIWNWTHILYYLGNLSSKVLQVAWERNISLGIHQLFWNIFTSLAGSGWSICWKQTRVTRKQMNNTHTHAHTHANTHTYTPSHTHTHTHRVPTLRCNLNVLFKTNHFDHFDTWKSL